MDNFTNWAVNMMKQKTLLKSVAIIYSVLIFYTFACQDALLAMLIFTMANVFLLSRVAKQMRCKRIGFLLIIIYSAFMTYYFLIEVLPFHSDILQQKIITLGNIYFSVFLLSCERIEYGIVASFLPIILFRLYWIIFGYVDGGHFLSDLFLFDLSFKLVGLACISQKIIQVGRKRESRPALFLAGFRESINLAIQGIKEHKNPSSSHNLNELPQNGLYHGHWKNSIISYKKTSKIVFGDGLKQSIVKRIEFEKLHDGTYGISGTGIAEGLVNAAGLAYWVEEATNGIERLVMGQFTNGNQFEGEFMTSDGIRGSYEIHEIIDDIEMPLLPDSMEMELEGVGP